MALQPGDTVGFVTVVSHHVDARRGYWRCLCQCGAYVERSTLDLEQALKQKRIIACQTCFQHHIKTIRHREGCRYAQRRWRTLWELYGTFWDGATYEEKKDLVEPTLGGPYNLDEGFHDAIDEAYEKTPRQLPYAMTLEEIAATMGITRERVRQIEERALRKCRKVLETDPFREVPPPPTKRLRPLEEAGTPFKVPPPPPAPLPWPQRRVWKTPPEDGRQRHEESSFPPDEVENLQVQIRVLREQLAAKKKVLTSIKRNRNSKRRPTSNLGNIVADMKQANKYAYLRRNILQALQDAKEHSIPEILEHMGTTGAISLETARSAREHSLYPTVALLLSQMCRTGTIERVQRGLYRLPAATESVADAVLVPES